MTKVKLKPKQLARIERWPDQCKSKTNFETVERAFEEDKLRAKALLKAAFKCDDEKRFARKLSKLLSDKGDIAQTLASSRHMRRLRVAWVRKIWRLVVESGLEAVSFFTLVPKNWLKTNDEMGDSDPKALLAALKALLYRHGAKEADGWLIAAIHGEFDPLTERWQLHVHGIASEDMIAVIDRLRTLPNFRSNRTKSGKMGTVFQRVHRTNKPLTDLPEPLTYILQSFWPSRPIFWLENGEQKRRRKKMRIPEPFHSRLLLWMHRHSVEDLILKIGLRETPKRLKRSHKKSYKLSKAKS